MRLTEDSVITVDSSVMKKLKKSSRESSAAIAYLLGCDTKGIVKEAIQLTNDGGCEQMPRTDAPSFVSAAANLWGKDLIVCGIARVGKEICESNNYGIPADNVGRLRTDTFSITVRNGKVTNVFKAYTQDGSMYTKKLKHEVLSNQKRKEVRENGKRKSDKGKGGRIGEGVKSHKH